jgi:hypothetical protein
MLLCGILLCGVSDPDTKEYALNWLFTTKTGPKHCFFIGIVENRKYSKQRCRVKEVNLIRTRARLDKD